MGGRPRKSSHNTQNDKTKHLKIRRRGLRLSIQSSFKKARTNPQPRNKICTGSVCSLPHSERSLRSGCIYISRHEKFKHHNHSHQYDPIRPYCLNPIKLDEYALRPATPKPLFVRAMEYFGKLQIDTRKIERLTQYFRRTSTITESITNYA
jgi:hypothetical protein